jgi:hypothetical protein
MNISNYLEKIQNDESIFPMDSPSKKKKTRKYYSEAISKSKASNRMMIDFDLTIYKYSKGFEDGILEDDAFDGAKETIDWLKGMGFEIVIFTARASKENAEDMGTDHLKQIKNIENFLDDKGIYFDRITSEKLSANFYIDDKAITIENGDWDSVKKIIRSRMKV